MSSNTQRVEMRNRTNSAQYAVCNPLACGLALDTPQPSVTEIHELRTYTGGVVEKWMDGWMGKSSWGATGMPDDGGQTCSFVVQLTGFTGFIKAYWP